MRAAALVDQHQARQVRAQTLPLGKVGSRAFRHPRNGEPGRERARRRRQTLRRVNRRRSTPRRLHDSTATHRFDRLGPSLDGAAIDGTRPQRYRRGGNSRRNVIARRDEHAPAGDRGEMTDVGFEAVLATSTTATRRPNRASFCTSSA